MNAISILQRELCGSHVRSRAPASTIACFVWYYSERRNYELCTARGNNRITTLTLYWCYSVMSCNFLKPDWRTLYWRICYCKYILSNRCKCEQNIVGALPCRIVKRPWCLQDVDCRLLDSEETVFWFPFVVICSQKSLHSVYHILCFTRSHNYAERLKVTFGLKFYIFEEETYKVLCGVHYSTDTKNGLWKEKAEDWEY